MTATVREQLLREAVRFVHEAKQVPGVRAIALVGSITTSKARPKDIDLLVTVEDSADLAVLATHSRRLSGRLQGLSLGADVFLANLQHQYIGRVCGWRECRPGIRMSCDAEHCGRRAHLHDDLGTVHLSPGLVAAPPLVIWPTVVRQVALPADLEAWVTVVSHAV
jgi:predicted nucleotidyltransferase